MLDRASIEDAEVSARLLGQIHQIQSDIDERVKAGKTPEEAVQDMYSTQDTGPPKEVLTNESKTLASKSKPRQGGPDVQARSEQGSSRPSNRRHKPCQAVGV